jgi:hypothetical protein
MKFQDWNNIYESAKNRDVLSAAESIASQIEKEIGKKLYVIPEIDKFTRPGEPSQTGYLISDDNARSMKLNFTEDGEFYSVDYWKAGANKPSITVYLNDLPSDKAFAKLMAYYKNPVEKKVEENVEGELIVTEPAQTREADKKIIKVQKEVEYEFQDPREVFEDLATYIDMVVDGDMYSLLLTGQAGVGKTYLVTKKLEQRGLKRNEDYFKITGKTTAAGMYMTLYQYNGKMILFDDCDSVFGDDNAVNVLKGALDTAKIREISWNSAIPLKTPDKKDVPKRFDFTGKVIFISNLAKKKVDPAIRSRAFMLEIALTKEDMISRMWSLLPKVELPSGVVVGGAIRKKAMNMIVEAAEQNENIELNMRTLLKAISIVNKVKNEETAQRLIAQQCAGV